MNTNSGNQGLTLLLAALATYTAGLGVVGTGYSKGFLLEAGIMILLMAIGFFLAHWAASDHASKWLKGNGGKRLEALFIVLAMAIPAIEQWMGAPFAGGVLPMAVVGMLGVRNAMIVSAVFCRRHRRERLAVAGSLFVIVFGFALSTGVAAFVCAVLYAALAAVYLARSSWIDAEQSAPNAGESRRRHSSTGRWTWLLAMTVTASMFGAVFLYPAEARVFQQQMAEWIGIRQRLTAGEIADRLRNQQQMLDDLAGRKYGLDETLDADGMMGADEGNLFGESLANAKRFSLRRQAPSAGESAGDSAPDEMLFYAKGHAPLFMPVTSYSHFDGVDWYSEPLLLGQKKTLGIHEMEAWLTEFDHPELLWDQQSGEKIESQELSAWYSAQGDYLDKLRAVAAQQFMAHWETPTAKADAEAIDINRLRKVLQTEPGWSKEVRYLLTHYDLHWMVTGQHREKSPGGENTPISPSEAKKLLAALAQAAATESGRKGILHRIRQLRRRRQAVLPPAAVELVNRWTADHSPGWPQIQAVVAGLRSHASHDPSARIPPQTDDPISHFLLDSRRGPDYMFASSCVVILRSLGYPSRMVGGFHAPKKRYNFFTGRAEVHPQDLHYWVQTRLSNDYWVDLEPTPGYDPPQPPRSWSDRTSTVVADAKTWLTRNALAILLLLGTTTAIVITRKRIMDRAAVWRWRLSCWLSRPGRTRRGGDRLVLATWRLLERRANSAVGRRPCGTTLADWYPALFLERPQTRSCLAEMAVLHDWARYSPQGVAGDPRYTEEEIQAHCRTAVKVCNLAAFRRVGGAGPIVVAGGPVGQVGAGRRRQTD